MKLKLSLFLITIAISLFVEAQETLYNRQLIFKGQVLDNNGQGIPFVNIGIRGTLLGAASNEDGHFTLKLPGSVKKDSIFFSCVGYQTIGMTVSEMSKNSVFILSDDISNLGEIEIQSERETALDVMQKVIDQIPVNYLQEPFVQKKFYRKKVKYTDSRDYYLLEKIEEEYDDDGYSSSVMYGLGKDESFRTTWQCRIGRLDTLSGKVGTYVNYQKIWSTQTAWSDVVNSRRNNFLSKGKYKKYDFQFDDRGLDNRDTIYIDFSIVRPSHRSTTSLAPLKYAGTILIDANDYAVLEVSTTSILDKKKIWMAKNNPRFKTEDVWWEKTILKYKKIGDRYYFGSLQRLSNWDHDREGVTEIIGLGILVGIQDPEERSDRAPVEEYDPEKWQTFIQNEY